MAWKSSGLNGKCIYLLIVILFLPCEITSSVLTVNDKTENYILDTMPGSYESLKCAVQNPTREEELLWYRQEGTVDLKSGNKKNSSSVCVSPVSEDDNGVTFTCKLQRDQSVSLSVVLNVTFSPILSGDDVQTVEEGSEVKLVCKVKSNPQAQMIWHKNGNLLNLEKNHHQIQQTSEFLQLSFTKVKKSDNGTYTCIASSTMNKETKDFYLIVKDRVLTVPIEPIIAACVVVFLTLCFGVIARRNKIMKLCRRGEDRQTNTALDWGIKPQSKGVCNVRFPPFPAGGGKHQKYDGGPRKELETRKEEKKSGSNHLTESVLTGELLH
ncbi:PREDICTED: transmembrane and immunoglobulin domain-containing protein 1 [Condylura cristata]|uniref:transmembrane and immunoglobulin domain-containing protein 1 n=1 Tax=Condylura cristata TaxID=143302 RepID=UPI0003347C77|nr:PREDICTED: transmembrane and immunoglobulin domain-containing protein 1 [Condylura cristata]